MYDQWLDVGLLHPCAQDIVSGRTPRTFELFREPDALPGKTMRFGLYLRDAFREKCLEISALDFERSLITRFSLLQARCCADSSGRTCAGDYASTLEDRLGDAGVRGVRVGLVEDRPDGLRPRTLHYVTLRCVEPELRKAGRTRDSDLRLGNVSLSRRYASFVAELNSTRDSRLERQRECVAALCLEGQRRKTAQHRR